MLLMGELLNTGIEMTVITLQSEHSLDQEMLSQTQPFLEGLSEESDTENEPPPTCHHGRLRLYSSG